MDDEDFFDDDDLDAPDDDRAIGVLRRFAAATERVRWFRNLGDPLDADTRETARAYLDALGFPDVEVAPVHDFTEAADAAESLDWDAAGWEAEEQLRASLTARALDVFDEETLTAALLEVRARASAAARIGIDEAAALFDETDEALINAAVGAAIQACHQAALVLAAGEEDDHPFALKFQLFEAGRWPIGLAGRSLNLF